MLPDGRSLASIFAEPLDVDLRFGVERIRSRDDPSDARATALRPGRAALRTLRAEVEGRALTEDLEFPHPRYSLSHSRDVAVAVADASASLAGIGVDVEIERTLKSQAARFFLTDRERRWLETADRARHSDHLLRLWCIKEAVFKANPDNDGTLLGNYQLDDAAASCGAARTREGRLVEYASWIDARTCVAVAVCRRG